MAFSKDSVLLLKSRIREYGSAPNMQDSLINYLLYGFDPGSCYRSFFANDAMGTFSHGHPLNSFDEFKIIASFIKYQCPKIAFGSYGNIELWCNLKESERRQYLEKANLVYPEEEELMVALQNEHLVMEPNF